MAVEVGLDVFGENGGHFQFCLDVSADCNYNVSMKRKSTKQKLREKSDSNALTTKLVRIGNSRGVRLPKTVIEQAGLSDAIEVCVRGNQVILRAAAAQDPRAGWEEAIKRSIEKYGPPEPIDPDWELMRNEFDDKEWKW